MDFQMTDEQRMVKETIRAFVTRELIPLENEVLLNEREGRPSLDGAKIRQLQLKAREAGFWGLNTPEEYGGANLGAVMTAITRMELARTFVPFTFGGSADNILYRCNEEQKQRYLLPTISGERRSCFALTEPSAGSDVSNIQMTAVKDGKHWVLNGEKIFITNGNEADFTMAFAITDKEKRSRGGVTCFLVDRSMGWRSSPIPTMGEWSPASLYFEDVRVPEENILGGLNEGFNLAMQWIGIWRWNIGVQTVGACERLLQMAIDYAKTRETFGKPIAERQAIQWMIADSYTEIEATRWLALYAAWLYDQQKDPRHASSVSKLFGANVANRIVDRVLQIHGGMGYTRELPIERWYREMRLWRIFDGTDEVQRLIISRNLLKGHVTIGETLS